MRLIILIIFLLSFRLSVLACETCEKQQPKILKGVTHGAGPDGNWDYVFVVATIIIVLVTLFYTIRWVLHPGEKNMNHIKRSILN